MPQKPSQIVLDDDSSIVLVDESTESQHYVERKLPVSIEEPASTLLWLGLLGYCITIVGSFLSSGLTDCFNTLCCGSFISTVLLSIYYANYGNWEKATGKNGTNANLNAVLLGFVASIMFIFYLYLFNMFGL